MSDACMSQTIGGGHGIVDKMANGARSAYPRVGARRCPKQLGRWPRRMGSLAGAGALEAAARSAKTIGSDMIVVLVEARVVPAEAGARSAGCGNFAVDGVVMEARTI